MRKSIFAFLVIITLIGGTYLLGRDNGGTATVDAPKELGVIQITGLVERPYNITYGELRKLPSREVESPLYCVSQPDQVRK
uniref:hypothetical protein n=1 Tax=Thermococcus sp. TaxID=35749 RepID=UPI00262072D1